MIKSAKAAPEQNTIGNRILPGTKIKGDIESTGDLRIDGEIEGNVTLQGKLIIGEQGAVVGDIRCSEAIVSGKHVGTALVTELLTLTASAKVQGEVQVAKLSVEVGAAFTGSCKMGAVVRQMEKSNESTQGERRKEGLA